METIYSKYRLARKIHVCDTCGGSILQGETYEHQTNKFDGELYSWKNCEKCKDIRDLMFGEGYYPNGVTSQDFWDFVRDNELEFERDIGCKGICLDCGHSFSTESNQLICVFDENNHTEVADDDSCNYFNGVK